MRTLSIARLTAAAISLASRSGQAGKETRWPTAETPASVRPAHARRNACLPPRSGSMASCRQPATVGFGASRCHAKHE